MSLITHAEFVAFDLETTGLSPAFDRIVEVGAVRFRADGSELERMEQLVDPRCRIPHNATAIHGITDAMVRGKPSIEQVLPAFLRFLGDRETVLLAHNASFDVGFLSAALGRCPASHPGHAVVDTLALSRLRLSRLRNHRLETIARHFRIANPAEHRALGDALVVRSAFQKLLALPPAVTRCDDLLNLIRPLHFEPMILKPVAVPSRYEPLVEAIEVGRTISIVYTGGTKGQGTRQITPRNLIEVRGSQYLIAHCHIDGMEKSFRLDRILEMTHDRR